MFLDLVGTQEMYLPAFWHVMRDTIIAEDVDGAIRLNNGVKG